jgi:hypothetical protein
MLCITEKTARIFILKIREAMAFSGNNLMDSDVQVHEFVLAAKKD